MHKHRTERQKGGKTQSRAVFVVIYIIICVQFVNVEMIRAP